MYHEVISYFIVNLGKPIQAVDDQMSIQHFGSDLSQICSNFAQIWNILKGEMGSQGSWVESSRAQALPGLGSARAQARLLQPLVPGIKE